MNGFFTKPRVTCDLVIVSIGITPENKLAREAGLEIGERGGITVDATMRTSEPNICAVGDAVEIKDFVAGLPTITALAEPANRQGRIAGDNPLGRRSIFKETTGTTVIQVFDLTVATTMAIKLIFSPSSGKILGGQIVGTEGMDKRIDVLATAIRGAMTVYDLEELELAYAPPYSSTKDAVNTAGCVPANILKGDLETIYWNEITDLDRDRDILIDLRNTDELDISRVIQGALHKPLNGLCKRLPELDKE